MTMGVFVVARCAHRRHCAGRGAYDLAFPDAVLRTLYYENALKLMPGLPRSGFPG